MKKKYQKGMTLFELLIVTSLISLLVIGVIVLLNPQEQIAKSRDAVRKNDLNELRKIMEDWMSNNNCYPKKTEVCYNDVSNTTCEICTSSPGSPSIANYTSSVVCDPESPLKNYLYEAQGDSNCPSNYVIYSKLSAQYSKENDVYSCGPLHGCGPNASFGYDYLVSSANAVVAPAGNYYCLSSANRCTNCGTYATCSVEVTRRTCRSIYPSKAVCCSTNPSAGFCP